MSFIIREARKEDTLAIQHFIARAGVPADLEQLADRQFLLAEHADQTIAATAALQRVSSTEALIRSLIIDSEKAGPGFLLNMLESVRYYAWENHVETVYLMVSKAAGIMEPLGFDEVGENQLPPNISAVADVQKHLDEGKPVYKQTKPGDK